MVPSRLASESQRKRGVFVVAYRVHSTLGMKTSTTKTVSDYEINDIREAMALALADRRWNAVSKYAAQLADAESANAHAARAANDRGFSMFA